MRPGMLTLAGPAALVWAAFAWNAPALAQASLEERLAGMERRIQYLEARVAAQDRTIVEKDRQLARLAGQEDAWFNGVEIGGVVEVEAVHESPYEGGSATSAGVSTVELGIAAQVSDSVGAEVVLLYEGEDTDEKFEVDVAALTLAPPEAPWQVVVGQHYVPFGTFETNLVSDPLTLEIGETRETALLVGGEAAGGVEGAVYLFDGDNSKDGEDGRITGFGAALGWSMEHGDGAFGANLSWINDVGDSDGLSLGTVARHVPGWAASFNVNWGAASLIGEYVAAMEAFAADEIEFDGRGAKPAAWTIEAAYEFDLGGRAAVAAASWQGTRSALALGLPEQRLLAGLSVEVSDGTALAFEWAQDSDYDAAKGGTGKKADTFTVLLGAEF